MLGKCPPNPLKPPALTHTDWLYML